MFYVNNFLDFLELVESRTSANATAKCGGYYFTIQSNQDVPVKIVKRDYQDENNASDIRRERSCEGRKNRWKNNGKHKGHFKIHHKDHDKD